MAIVHIPAQIVIKMNIIDLGISGIRSGAQKGLDNARSEFKYLYTNNIRKEGSTMVIPRNRGVSATNNYNLHKNMVIGKVVLLHKIMELN